jgi:hypothetical protein
MDHKRTSAVVDGDDDSWVAPLPQKTNYVTFVRGLLKDVATTPSQIAFVVRGIAALDPSMFDLRNLVSIVKRPSECKDQRLVAFAQAVHDPLHPIPVDPKVTTWEEFDTMLETVEYRDQRWQWLHGMFVTASSLARAAGQGDMSIERYFVTCTTTPVVKPPNYFALYIPQRGLEMEHVMRVLYERYLPVRPGRSYKIVTPKSKLVPFARWIMATPDLSVYDTETGELLFNVEIKCPTEKAAFFDISHEHMLQMHFAALTNGAKVCHYVCLKISDRDSRNVEIYIHRVEISNEYICAVLPVIKQFYAAVLANKIGNVSLPRRTDFVPPHVKTEIIFHLLAPLEAVDGLPTMYHDAILRARQTITREVGDRNQRTDQSTVADEQDDLF